jgi:hypothetical protein
VTSPGHELGVGDRAALGTAAWEPITFRDSLNGDAIEVHDRVLPADFAARLRSDLVGLRREVEDQAVIRNLRLIETSLVMVDGTSGFCRIVRAPAGLAPFVVYVAGVAVPLEGEIGTEIIITCGDMGYLPRGRDGEEEPALTRVRRRLAEVIPSVQLHRQMPGQTCSRC